MSRSKVAPLNPSLSPQSPPSSSLSSRQWRLPLPSAPLPWQQPRGDTFIDTGANKSAHTQAANVHNQAIQLLPLTLGRGSEVDWKLKGLWNFGMHSWHDAFRDREKSCTQTQDLIREMLLLPLIWHHFTKVLQTPCSWYENMRPETCMSTTVARHLSPLSHFWNQTGSPPLMLLQSEACLSLLPRHLQCWVSHDTQTAHSPPTCNNNRVL